MMKSCVFAFALMVIMLVTPCIAADIETGPVKEIYSGDLNQNSHLYVKADGSNVLIGVINLKGTAPEDNRLVLYNLVSGETETVATDIYPATDLFDISGNNLLWYQGQGIMTLYDFKEKTKTNISLYRDFGRPSAIVLDSDRILTSEADLYSNHTDIFLLNITTGEKNAISKDPKSRIEPAISGDIIIWRDRESDPFANVYGFDLNKNYEFAVHKEPFWQGMADISGDFVVWLRDESVSDALQNTSKKIFLTNLSENTTIMIAESFDDLSSPKIEGDYVIWEDKKDGRWTLWLYEISTGNQEKIANLKFGYDGPLNMEISGNNIFWTDQDDTGRAVIRTVALQNEGNGNHEAEIPGNEKTSATAKPVSKETGVGVIGIIGALLAGICLYSNKKQ
ncbi:hypothetical protein F1737_05070 [Methanoplanus sp. FWC-SCC4]|uniref:Uncharacterized protein n=1 Tax=Methanochimaera problematica TaxID=2609417 RepID=A0AA97FB21_9EURY|nr:hypothetical protein [Methanoplanus sp. FWC-SCC4]WOF16120.1 hypothetical protein F1737_05070 [Methanoplanus sp. FWC-SCC4]